MILKGLKKWAGKRADQRIEMQRLVFDIERMHGFEKGSLSDWNVPGLLNSWGEFLKKTKDFHQTCLQFEPDLARLSARLGGSHDSMVEKRIRIFVCPSSPNAPEKLSKLKALARKTDQLLDYGFSLPKMKKRHRYSDQSEIEEHRQFIASVFWRQGPEAFEEELQENREILEQEFQSHTNKINAIFRKRGVKNQKRRRKKHFRKSISSTKVEATEEIKEQTLEEKRQLLQDILNDSKEAIITLGVDNQSLEEEIAEIEGQISKAKEDIKWESDRIKYLQRKIMPVIGIKNRLLKQIENLGHDISEYQTKRALITLLKTPVNIDNSHIQFSDIQDALLANAAIKGKQNADSDGNLDLRTFIGVNDEVFAAVEKSRQEEDRLRDEKNQLRVLKNGRYDHLAILKRNHRNVGKDVDRLEALREGLNIEIPQLKYELSELKSGLSSQSEFNEKSSYPPLTDLKKWAAANLNGHVILHKNTFKKAAKSQYENPDLIYKSLTLLANEFWTQKMSGELFDTDSERQDTRDAFNQKLHDLHLSIGGSVTTKSNQKMWDAYHVSHRGKKVFLSHHLTKGASFDPKRHLRIYFAWQEDEKAVLVGHLPEHLPTAFD